jgi:hypothetical protein
LYTTLEDMGYVDNVCLTSHIFLHMQRKLDDLWEESKKVGLVINSMKREEVCVNTTVNQDPSIKFIQLQDIKDIH